VENFFRDVVLLDRQSGSEPIGICGAFVIATAYACDSS